ncbi:molecular chaperone OsmY [Candidatus Fukatsuia symbiotica]|uniref:Osmotically-inducible protein Y n=1 Tax=Candidatus Fukatsuia symbiotica TaxID=1878942 RepID=A0A2U8I422_9GAMM|nr:molecular chaperone OsmY [Candidatus Fukatsuia symbiotica]AWK13890.1 molecular chaperone OsmY [Candidatus Fukatsuia symbiotica]MEA9445774.1 molecular chaperone OsmY [Candidatus Fukatsuia symbiotica]
MKNTKFIHSLIAVAALGTLSLSSGTLAEGSIGSQVSNTMENAGAKIDNSLKKVDDSLKKIDNAATEDSSGIAMKVKKALLEDESLKQGGNISVATKDGVVTLSGSVHNLAQSEKAMAVAAKVMGVKSVNNKLEVVKENTAQSISAYTDDATITSKVKAKLLTTGGVPSHDIKVVTTGGVVQLTGDVENAEQSKNAEKVAKETDGVNKVINDIKVKH